METLNAFIARNQNYTRYESVSPALISKYENVLPPEILYIWKTFGLGTFEGGFMRFVNPDEYIELLGYCRTRLEPTDRDRRDGAGRSFGVGRKHQSNRRCQ